ncbi:formylglycine-generating enzyme family protein [Planktotalea sp.]|uniref:formylglycine-generating enzyme family protein n=1 Tax=Planktotalea sp. TaxID=2029877 RepID=UPI003299341E
MDSEAKGCCTPAREPSAHGDVSKPIAGHVFHPQAAIAIAGGKAMVGTKTPFLTDDGESPLRSKRVQPFKMMQTTVTNASFQAFVEETGYVTEAEQFGWSFVFHSDVPECIGATQGVVGTEWWRRVDGANWRQVHGAGSQIPWDPDHPVTQVSWRDATAFAQWCGGRLPNEAEWEHAARGGLGDVPFPWGTEEPDDKDVFPCNIWQGDFPNNNKAADGWLHTAPAKSFEPNGYGLYNMVGNVWEWTSEPYRVKSLKKRVTQRLEGMRGFKLLKGGSFLCHRSYCYRYRIAARSGNAPDSATPHQGFRVVWDA